MRCVKHYVNKVFVNTLIGIKRKTVTSCSVSLLLSPTPSPGLLVSYKAYCLLTFSACSVFTHNTIRVYINYVLSKMVYDNNKDNSLEIILAFN
jgi:hypothetical protein